MDSLTISSKKICLSVIGNPIFEKNGQATNLTTSSEEGCGEKVVKRLARRTLHAVVFVLCLISGPAFGQEKIYCYGGACFSTLGQAESVMRATSPVGKYLKQAGVGFHLDQMLIGYKVHDQPAETYYRPVYYLGGNNFGCNSGVPGRPSACDSQDALMRGHIKALIRSHPSCREEESNLVGSYAEPFVESKTVHYLGQQWGELLSRGARHVAGYSCQYPYVADSRVRYSDAEFLRFTYFKCPDGFYSKSGQYGKTEGLEMRSLCRAWNSSDSITVLSIQQVDSCPANPNPCHPATGDKSRAEHDFDFAGRPFVRHYHSLRQIGGLSGFGAAGWSHNYSMRLVRVGGHGHFVLLNERGNYENFGFDGGGRFRSSSSGRLMRPGYGGKLRLSGGAGEEYEFDAGGNLVAVEGGEGGRVDLVYAWNRLVSMTDGVGRVLRFEYEGDLLLRAVKPDGVVVGYSYDDRGNLTEVDFGNGNKRRCHYAEPTLARAEFTHHLTGISDESGQRYASFGYDQWGRVTSSRLHDGNREVESTTLTYQSNTEVDVSGPSGLVRRYTMTNQPFRHIEQVAGGPDAYKVKSDYFGRVISRTDASGSVTTYEYEDGNLSATIHAKGTAEEYKITYGRDTNRHVLRRSTLVRNGTEWKKLAATSFGYDKQGRRAAVCAVDANGPDYDCGASQIAPSGVRQMLWSRCEQSDAEAGFCPVTGMVIAVKGARTDAADTTTYTYYPSDDATCASTPTTCPHRKGDLWKVTNAKGQVTETLRYDGAGRPLSVKDPNGVITDYEYHPRGWLTASKVRGPDDAVETDDAITRIAYWPTGLVQRVTQPDGAFTHYTYDQAHRLTDITDNAGNTIHYTLDNASNRIAEETQDAGGALKRSLSRVYNQLGQLATQADAQAHPTDFTYDANGNLNTVTDALGRVTDNDHDPLNRLARTLQDVGGIAAETKFQYDALDNLTKVTDPKGLDTSYTYNGLGDLTKLQSPDTGTTTYTYDSAGNRASQTDARGVTTTYAYDVLNRLTAVNYPDTALNVSYAYDSVPTVCEAGETFGVGRLSGLDDASGSTRYCYNRFGHLVRKVQTTNGVSFVVRYAYTLGGNLQAMVYPDGTTVDYGRNALGQVTEVGVTRSGQPRQVLLNQATYHPFGPVAGWTYGNGRTLTRTLDQDYRPLTIEDPNTGGLSLGFGYDAVGNLTQLGSAQGMANPAIRFGYDALGRLTRTEDGPTQAAIDVYAYDATGNRTAHTTAAGTAAYSYPTTSHRLTDVAGVPRSYDAVGNTTAIGGARGFAYNDANRMSLVQQAGVTARQYTYNGRGEQVRRYLGTTNTYTVYDEAGHWLGDYDDTGTPVQQALWMDDLPVGLLANGQQLHYVQPDHLGSPRVVIEAARNVPVWTWDLKGEAFGSTAPQPDPDGDGIAFVLDMRFPGQRYDAASALNQNYHRDYDASAGRYAQSDPIGLIGGTSTYAYVMGNPIMAVDTLGLKTCLLTTVGPAGIRDHAAIYTSRGDGHGGPSLYDPAGDYGAANGGGSGGVVEGEAASIEKFRKFHSNQEVESTCKNTSQKEEESIINNAINLPFAPAGTCARRASSALSGQPSFPYVEAGTWFPGNLLRDVRKGP